MEAKINILEVASDLAHRAMLYEINNPMFDDFILDEDEVYDFDEEGNGTYKEEYQSIFDRWYNYFFEILVDKMDTTYFSVSSTCREDLEGIGFDTSKVDDDTMKRLASKLGDDYCEQLYWSSLSIIAEHLNIPKK